MSFSDLEQFNQKTVYNYVQRLREEEDIPKDSEGTNRPYCMLEQTPPAEYAQVDFGEKWVDGETGAYWDSPRAGKGVLIKHYASTRHG